MTLQVLDRSWLQQDLSLGKITRRESIGIRNHLIWFPVLLVVYLLHLVILQTSLWWRDSSIWFLLIDSTFLLALLIVSGLATIRESDLLQNYTKSISHIYIRYAYIWLCLVLGMGTYHILMTQLQSADQDLSYIYIAISICAWWLIWLVWIVIADEQETE